MDEGKHVIEDEHANNATAGQRATRKEISDAPRLSLRQRLNFMIIGVQKAGTTALDAHLREHPHLQMAEDGKELHFFDNDLRFPPGQPADYRALHRHFARRRGRRQLGEATPSYIFLPRTLERIHQYNPQMKLIVILRNPITRAFSHWNMERVLQKESLSFLEAVRQEQARLAAADATVRDVRSFSYVSRGYYVRQLQYLWRVFPKEQTLVLRQEALKADPLDVVNRVSDFLGVGRVREVSEQKGHRREYAAPMTLDEWRALRDIFEPEILELQALLGWDCSSWLEAPTEQPADYTTGLAPVQPNSVNTDSIQGR